MTKHAIKFLLGALGMVILGFGVLYALPFFESRNQAANYLIKREEEMKQAIYADTYGGNSPEETLELYIDAIKKRDIDLAVKYYAVPQQDKAREYLANLTDEEANIIISSVSRARNGKLEIDSDIARFSYIEKVNDGYVMVDGRKIPVPPGDSIQTIELGRNPNRKWKILYL